MSIIAERQRKTSDSWKISPYGMIKIERPINNLYSQESVTVHCLYHLTNNDVCPHDVLKAGKGK